MKMTGLAGYCTALTALGNDVMIAIMLKDCSAELRQTLTMSKQVCSSDSGTAYMQILAHVTARMHFLDVMTCGVKM